MSDLKLRQNFGPLFLSVADVEAIITEVLIVAEWRDELLRKLERATLCFGFGSPPVHENQSLSREMKAFRQLCRSLADYVSRGTL